MPTRVLLVAAMMLAGLAGCAKPTYCVLDDLPTPSAHPGPTPTTLPAESSHMQPAAQSPVAGLPAECVPVVHEQAWRYIVIHHSATEGGNAAIFDQFHRSKGWDELGYHFVITNGNGGPDGQIEVGSRWCKQKWGAHAGGSPDNEYNNYGIGICLVGDFNTRRPTDKQLESLRRLTAFLMERYDIPPTRVIGHRDVPGANTDCPGNLFYPYVVGLFRQQLAGR